MTTYLPQYRLTLFQLPSVDPAETTVLTPAAGAPHSDQFKITTLANLAGWKPYLQQFRGRRGRIDDQTRKLDIGSLMVDMIDAKTTLGQNANRWVMAFFGDAKGRPRGHHRALIEESLDNGTTWVIYWTGRVIRRKLTSRSAWSLEIRDDTDALKMKAFVGEPHSSITYAGLLSVMPLGVLRSSYGTLQPVAPLTGTVSALQVGGLAFMPTAVAVGVDAASQARDENVVTQNLLDAAPPAQVTTATPTVGENIKVTWSLPVFTGRCRARVKHLSGALVGQTGDYTVGALQLSKPKNGRQALTGFTMQQVDVSDRNALAIPADGVLIEFTMFLDQEINDKAPLMLNDVDAAQLIQDLCDGKFGYWYRPPETLPTGKSYGDVKKTVACANSAAFIGTRPLQRFLVKKAQAVIDFIETALLEQMNWAVYMDRQARLTIVDLTTPTSLGGLPTIVDTDTVATDVQWDHDTETAITRVDFTHYVDQPITASQLQNTSGAAPQLDSSGIVQEFDAPIAVLNVGSSDFTDASKKIDVLGFRTMQGEMENGQDKFKLHESYLGGLANQLRMPYGWGASTLPLVCRRTATITGLTQGALALLNVSWVPNPTTNQRGGTRVVRVLEISEDGERVTLQLLDLGVNAGVAAPTLGALVLETSNGYTGVNLPITLNANSDLAECRFAITATSVGVIPADTSPLWTFGFLWSPAGTAAYSMSGMAYASGTSVLRALPPGQRVWVQVRSVPLDKDPHFPSVWVSPSSGNAFIDMTAVPAPSALSASLITGHTARVSFTPGATDLQTQVQLTVLPNKDTFTQADGTLHANTETGPPWTQQSGTWTVASNKAKQTNTNGNFNLVTPGSADGVLTGDVTISGTASRANSGFCFRNIDDNNQLLLAITNLPATNTVRLYKHTLAGGFTSLQEANPAVTAGSTYNVIITLSGTNIKVSVNGTQYINYTLAAGAEANTFTSPANVGLWTGAAASGDDTGTTWDNFSWVPAGVPSTGTPTVTFATLQPGSTLVDLVDLDVSTTFTVALKHILGQYPSAVATIYVTTAGSGTTAANIGGISVIH